MAIRDQLIGVVDRLRRDVVDEAFGLRLDSIVVRTTAWSGGQIGRGTATHSDLTLDPVPKASRPSPRLMASAPGVYESGDVLVSRISATYTEAQLTDQGMSKGVQRIWLVNGEPYRPVGFDEKYLGWNVHLRRMRDR